MQWRHCFCFLGLCIPTKTITSYPNEKPWFNTYIKHKLQAKQDTYKDNDKYNYKYKKARYAAEKAVKTGKAKYRVKLEENLTTNNSKNIWQGQKAITKYKPSPTNTTATDTNHPDRLNDLCSPFDKLNTTSPSSITPSSSLPPFTVDEYVVRRVFQRINSKRLPARITSLHVYLNCVPISCLVYSQTYSMCLFPNVKSTIVSKSQLSFLFPRNLQPLV